MAIYLASATGFLALVAVIRSSGEGWGLTALVTAAFVAWITVINLVYLLTQIVIASDGCSVATAIPRAAAFIRRERRTVGSVFLVVLALVIFATGASVLATTALGLIAFVPLFGLIVIPSEPAGVDAARAGFPVHWALVDRRLSQAVSGSESRPRRRPRARA